MIETANRLLIAGLVALAVAIVGAVLLVTDYPVRRGDGVDLPGRVALLLVALWFVAAARPVPR